MQAKIMSKEETKEAESNTTHIMNLMGTLNKEEMEKFGEFYHPIVSWYIGQGVKGFVNLRKRLAELLGHRALYHVNYEHRNAVWGFRYAGFPVVIYWCKEGIHVQVDSDMDKDTMFSFLRWLQAKLVNNETRKMLEEFKRSPA